MQFLLRLWLLSFVFCSALTSFSSVALAQSSGPSPSPSASSSPPPTDAPKIVALTLGDAATQRTRIRQLAFGSSVALNRDRLRSTLARSPAALQIRNMGKSLESPREVAWTSEQFEVRDGDGDQIASQIVWTPPQALGDGLLEVQIDAGSLLGYGGTKQRLYIHQLRGDFDGNAKVDQSERNVQAQYCAAYDQFFQYTPEEMLGILETWDLDTQGKILAETYRIGVSPAATFNGRLTDIVYTARRQMFFSLLTMLSAAQTEAFHRYRKLAPEAYPQRMALYQEFLNSGLGIAASDCALQNDANDDLEFSTPDLGTLHDAVLLPPQLRADHVFAHVPPLGTSLTQADCTVSPRSPYVAVFNPLWNDQNVAGWTMRWTTPKAPNEASRSQLHALADGSLCYIPSPFMPAGARETAQYRVQSARGEDPQIGQISFQLVYPGNYTQQRRDYTSDQYRREGVQPQEIAVVYNQVDPQGWSQQLASHYAGQHGVPPENIFGIHLPTLRETGAVAYSGYLIPDPTALNGLRNEVQAVRDTQRHTLVDVRDLEREMSAVAAQLPDSIQMIVLAWTYPNSVIYPVRVRETGEVLQVAGKDVLFKACHAVTSAVAFSAYQNNLCQQTVLQSTLGRGDALSILRANTLNYQMSAPLNPYFGSASSRPWTEHGMRPTLQLAGFRYSDLTSMIERGLASRAGVDQAEARLVLTSDGTRSGIRRAAITEAAALLKDLSAVKVVAQDLCKTDPSQCGPGLSSDYIADKTLSAPLVLYHQHTTYPMDTNLVAASGGRSRYAPGAIADHATSFGGVWWFPGNCGPLDASSACTGRNALGQLSSLSWIAGGATGSYGSVWEPVALTSRFPDSLILTARYYLGDTLGEAYWKSVLEPVGVFHGDPLARPFGSKFYKAQGLQYLRGTNFTRDKPVYALACQSSAPDSCLVLAGPLAGQGPLQGELQMQLPNISGAVYRLTEQPIVPE